MAKLGWNRYGKSQVRVVKVRRDGARHDLVELSVDVALEGAFEAAHAEGDNALVVPTDTMKNTVYALAKDHPIEPIESFALHLAQHFVLSFGHVERARVAVASVDWRRAEVGGAPHAHTFSKGGGERATCAAEAARDGVTIESGLDGLVILKTTASGFSGFLRDRYTTLRETDERILATALCATWTWSKLGAEYASGRAATRRALVETFARHASLSVQHTLHAMAEAALAACPGAASITLSMPNKHCLLADLSPFGLTNDNEIFVPVDEPFGLIEATVTR